MWSSPPTAIFYIGPPLPAEKTPVELEKIVAPDEAGGSYCPLDRYFINDLSARLTQYVPDWEGDFLTSFLAEEVNAAHYDRVAPNMGADFTSENSISGFEAFFYSREILINGLADTDDPLAQMGTGLTDIYLGGNDYLNTSPSPHYIIYKHCHDGDTCRVVEFQDEACQFADVETSVRISGIDAPEVGYYSTNSSQWVNSKLMENVEKLYTEWVGQVSLPAYVQKKIKRIIGMYINYTGRLAGLIRNDLNTWNDTQGVPRLIEESMIGWVWEGKGDKTPPILCGTWQPFDVFGRRLGSFYQLYPSYLESYLKLRLAELMSIKGQEIYEDFKEKVKLIVEELENIEEEKVHELLRMLRDHLPRPDEIYSPEQCQRLAQAFQELASLYGEEYARDDQLLQIVVGSVYAYEKYRNQDGKVYYEAGELARQQGYGLWGEATFKTLHDINERDPRYHPPYCP